MILVWILVNFVLRTTKKITINFDITHLLFPVFFQQKGLSLWNPIDRQVSGLEYQMKPLPKSAKLTQNFREWENGCTGFLVFFIRKSAHPIFTNLV